MSSNCVIPLDFPVYTPIYFSTVSPWCLLRAHFFCSGLHGYPDVEADSLGSSSGPETTPNNQERPEQKRECFNGGTRSNALSPERGTGYGELLCPWPLTLGCFVWSTKPPLFCLGDWRAFLQCSQSSWVLALFGAVAPTLQSLSFYLFSCQMSFQGEEEVGNSIEIVRNWQADSSIHMEMKRT